MGMGNFQPQNYGEDFNRSMIGMGNFVSGLQKANDDRAQRAIDNERNQVADERAGRATDTTIAHNEAATAKLQREVANEKLLQDITPIWAKQGKNLDDNELATLAQFNINFPAVPNSLESIPQFEEAHGNLMQATEFIKTQLPPSDKPYSIDPGMTPETDAALKSLQTVFSSDRFKKFVDADGSITGTKGAVYHTENNPSLIVNKPADGAASVVVRFPIVDDNGNPIFKKDANGNDTAERVLRPSTMGQSNDGNDRVNFVPVDMLQAKSAAALQQMQAVKNLSPEQQNKLTTLMYSLRPDGVKEMMASKVKDTTPIALADGGMLVGRDGKVLVENAKAAADKTPSRNTYKKDGYEITEEYDATSKTWKQVGKNKIKDPPDPDRRDRADREKRLKDDIDSSFRDFTTRRTAINKERTEFLKTYDPKDATNVAGLEDLNSRIADVENLSTAYTEKAADFKKEFGYVYQPGAGAVNKVPPKKGMATPPVKTQAKVQAKPAASEAMPPAANHSGRIIRDTVSGKRYKSNGTAWLEVK